METTKVFSELLAAYIDPAIRIIGMRGGARSSKTFSTLQLLNAVAARTKKRRLISVVSESMPHLKRGAIRDFTNILDGDGSYKRGAWHDTDKTYSYTQGRIEFFSVDQESKVMGPARDDLYVNEGINIGYNTYRQLAIRTSGKIIIDWNPAFEFWADTKLVMRPDFKLIDSTYRDNDMLSAGQIAEIESNRDSDPEWWKVYGEGKIGSREGLVIKKWDIVSDMPPRKLWKEAYIGVDFGWSAATAVSLVVLSQGEIYIDQLLYGPEKDNPDIAHAVHENGVADLEVICDAAEPKSIQELRGLGLRAVESKNKEIELGLRIMNRWKKHYTARSLDTIEENRKYRYPLLPDGTSGTIPIKKHGHAKDAERYVFLNRLSNIASGFDVTVSKTNRK